MLRNNVEPRRAWSRDFVSRSDELDFDDLHCASCGAASSLESIGSIAFCSDCLSWSKQAHLDSDYDDLGQAG